MSQKLSLGSLFARKIVRGDPLGPLFSESLDTKIVQLSTRAFSWMSFLSDKLSSAKILATKIVLSLRFIRQGKNPFSCIVRKHFLIAVTSSFHQQGFDFLRERHIGTSQLRAPGSHVVTHSSG